MVNDYAAIREILQSIDPETSGRTRNFGDGAVTRLSAYISRGVISTRMVAAEVLGRGLPAEHTATLIKELAWRDYFQQVWRARGHDIDHDLRPAAGPDFRAGMPAAIMHHCTGVEAVDRAIRQLYDTGYMHNHMRMYVAAMACNVARCHWQVPARWMHFHLRDADHASNALSHQWVAGTFSSKRYWANQENINHYFGTAQRGTLLDVPYEEFEQMPIPETLRETTTPLLRTQLPSGRPLRLDPAQPFCIYNFFNLDPLWRADPPAQRILLMEPSFFEKYPVCSATIDFVLALAQNIPDIQIAVAEFDQAFGQMPAEKIRFKEHPTNRHYRGVSDERDWLFPQVTGFFPSFSAYWKQCLRLMDQLPR